MASLFLFIRALIVILLVVSLAVCASVAGPDIESVPPIPDWGIPAYVLVGHDSRIEDYPAPGFANRFRIITRGRPSVSEGFQFVTVRATSSGDVECSGSGWSVLVSPVDPAERSKISAASSVPSPTGVGAETLWQNVEVFRGIETVIQITEITEV